jgi:transposase
MLGWNPKLEVVHGNATRVQPGIQARGGKTGEGTGVTAAQAARDLDVHENVLRKWIRDFAVDPQQAFPGKGVMKPELAEIERLKKEVAKLKMERDILKNRPRGLPRPLCLETRGA